MNLAAVVIWYNPQKVVNIVQKTSSYAHCIRVYIIDNSPNDNSDLAYQIPGAIYIPQLKNIGIAAAQNIGCRKALEDGFEWVITMDQDSYFETGQFERYVQEADNYLLSDEKAASFSVSIKDESEKILPLTTYLKIKLKTYLKRNTFSPPPQTFNTEPIDHPKRVFASANIINLAVWEEIGCFDEGLFIDEVDYDFDIRLQMAGYYITRFNNVYLNHKLGNRKFTVFPKYSYHTGERLFFIIRNKLIENRRYRYATELDRDYIKEVFRYFRDYCILDLRALQNLLIFTRAFFAYKRFIKEDALFHKLKEKGLAK